MKTIELKCIQKVLDMGQIVFEAYYLNDKLHNEHGPAFKSWNNEGTLLGEVYYLNNVRMTQKEWEHRVNSYSGKIVEIDGKKYKLEEL